MRPLQPHAATDCFGCDLELSRRAGSVVEVETGRPASFDGVVLIGLSLEDAEAAVNSLNALEVRCANLARRRVLDDLGTAWLYPTAASRT